MLKPQESKTVQTISSFNIKDNMGMAPSSERMAQFSKIPFHKYKDTYEQTNEYKSRSSLSNERMEFKSAEMHNHP